MAATEPGGFLLDPHRTHRWLRSISVITVIAAFALVVLGGVVRVTGSGLGCPDWPLCYGKVLPPLELTAILEYSHRFVASVIVGPLIIATCVTIWISYRSERWLTVPSILAVILLIGQALLGGVTVLQELPGEIVAAHLAVAEALLACLVLLAVVAFKGPLVRREAGLPKDRFPALALWSVLAVYLLILSGSFVTAADATRVCATWPLCQGEVFPKNMEPAIHMGHRYVALLAGLFVLYSVHLGFRGRRRPRDIRILSMSVATLLVVQVLVGAVAVWTQFPQWSLALHLALGSLVWIAMTATAFAAATRGGRFLRGSSGAAP